MTTNAYSASETPLDGNSLIESTVESLLKKVVKTEKDAFPDEFIREIKRYAKRNAFTLDYTIHNNHSNRIKVCCSQCVKAHALEKAKRMNLGKEAIKSIEEMFECEIGHNGYYLDREEVKKID